METMAINIPEWVIWIFSFWRYGLVAVGGMCIGVAVMVKQVDNIICKALGW